MKILNSTFDFINKSSSLIKVLGLIILAAFSLAFYHFIQPSKSSDTLLREFLKTSTYDSQGFDSEPDTFAFILGEWRDSDDIEGFWYKFVQRATQGKGLDYLIQTKDIRCNSFIKSTKALSLQSLKVAESEDLMRLADQCIASVRDLKKYYVLEQEYLKRMLKVKSNYSYLLSQSHQNSQRVFTGYERLIEARDYMQTALDQMRDKSTSQANHKPLDIVYDDISDPNHLLRDQQKVLHDLQHCNRNKVGDCAQAMSAYQQFNVNLNNSINKSLYERQQKDQETYREELIREQARRQYGN